MDPISVEKKLGERECRVSFSQSVAQQYEMSIMYHHKRETWTASKRGSSREIVEFIELAVPNLPDTKLINSALEELASKIRKGCFSGTDRSFFLVRSEAH